MTPDEIRIAVAECCGWKRELVSMSVAGGRDSFIWLNPNGVGDLPNYPASLDACAEMLGTLSEAEKYEYVGRLAFTSCADIQEGDLSDLYTLIAATPLQRCEAFLRVKGKWRDAQ